MILAGDIGGTNSRLALFAPEAGRPRILHLEHFRNAGEPGFETIAARFVAGARAALGDARVERACFALAGPVEGRRVKLTNLPWEVDADVLARDLAIDDVTLVNDFVAAASGLEVMGANDLHTLQAGETIADAPRVAIGAGTGLGVAYLVRERGGYRVIGGEGGHMGFAPNDDEQDRLWRFLHAGNRRVIAEEVVSGPGLERIHAFVRAEAGVPPAPCTSAEISAAALTGDALANRALDLFVSCFGAVAGDHALAVLARGGVFIAGGVAPKIRPRFEDGRFLAAFNAKGAHAHLAARMPVHIVTEEKLGLLGAALLAARGSEGGR
jgi:glucokinase